MTRKGMVMVIVSQQPQENDPTFVSYESDPDLHRLSKKAYLPNFLSLYEGERLNKAPQTQGQQGTWNTSTKESAFLPAIKDRFVIPTRLQRCSCTARTSDNT